MAGAHAPPQHRAHSLTPRLRGIAGETGSWILARAGVAQVNVTSFSKTGPVKAVDSRDWTETPSQKLMRLTAAAAAGPAAITLGPAGDLYPPPRGGPTPPTGQLTPQTISSSQLCRTALSP